MTDSEILVCNDDYYGWYRNEEIYDYDNDGDFITYTALETSNWKNSNLEPTYTWMQVLEYFNQLGLFGVVEYEGNETYVIKIVIKGSPSVRTDNKKYHSYYSCISALINNLIEVYKNGNQ